MGPCNYLPDTHKLHNWFFVLKWPSPLSWTKILHHQIPSKPNEYKYGLNPTIPNKVTMSRTHASTHTLQHIRPKWTCANNMQNTTPWTNTNGRRYKNNLSQHMCVVLAITWTHTENDATPTLLKRSIIIVDACPHGSCLHISASTNANMLVRPDQGTCFDAAQPKSDYSKRNLLALMLEIIPSATPCTPRCLVKEKEEHFWQGADH